MLASDSEDSSRSESDSCSEEEEQGACDDASHELDERESEASAGGCATHAHTCIEDDDAACVAHLLRSGHHTTECVASHDTVRGTGIETCAQHVQECGGAESCLAHILSADASDHSEHCVSHQLHMAVAGTVGVPLG